MPDKLRVNRYESGGRARRCNIVVLLPDLILAVRWPPAGVRTTLPLKAALNWQNTLVPCRPGLPPGRFHRPHTAPALCRDRSAPARVRFARGRKVRGPDRTLLASAYSGPAG